MNTGQENFQNVFDAINDFLFILDLNGNVIEINQAVSKFLGFTREDLKGKSVLMIHPPEYRERAAQIVGEMIAGTCESCPLPLLAKGGAYVPVETKVYPGKWNNEQVLFGISRNLSELTISEEKFHLVFESSRVMKAISDLDSGIFIDVNKLFLEKMGFAREEIIGRNSKDLNIFYDYGKRNELADKLKNNLKIEDEYVLIQTKEGKPIHCLFSISHLKIQTFNYIITSAIDISQLKETEQKLQKNLGRQTLLAEISQHFISLENFEENINQTLQLLGTHICASHVFIFEDNYAGTQTTNTYEWCNSGVESKINDLKNIPYNRFPSWKKRLIKQGSILSADISNSTDDVVDFFKLLSLKSFLCFPLYVQNRFFGSIVFDSCYEQKQWEKDDIELLRIISGIISNSFERQLFQKQLHESEIRQKMAIENTETGLWDWNIKTGEVYFNDIWCRMLGYDKTEIEPHVRSWEKLVHPDDMPKVMFDLNRHLNGECDFYLCTHRLLTKSGEWKWIIDKGRIIEYDNDHKPIRAIGTHIDIDHQKKVEEELRGLIATKDKLFSIIAHDLRGPIGTMMHISEMISEKEEFDEEAIYELNSQKELSQSTYQLLENLLSWASFNSQNIPFNPSDINLNIIIDETISGIKFKAHQKNISIITDYYEQIDAYADRDMVLIIIRNLLSNAVKFTEENGYVRIEMKRLPSFTEIKISDTGKGISKENIAKILSGNEFYSTRGTAKENGTGLGLKLCKSFIEQNKGELKVESIIDKGTCFSFTLPAMQRNL